MLKLQPPPHAELGPDWRDWVSSSSMEKPGGCCAASTTPAGIPCGISDACVRSGLSTGDRERPERCEKRAASDPKERRRLPVEMMLPVPPQTEPPSGTSSAFGRSSSASASPTPLLAQWPWRGCAKSDVDLASALSPALVVLLGAAEAARTGSALEGGAVGEPLAASPSLWNGVCACIGGGPPLGVGRPASCIARCALRATARRPSSSPSSRDAASYAAGTASPPFNIAVNGGGDAPVGAPAAAAAAPRAMCNA